eukprot:Gb_08394 [translate_table: standard]
MGGENVRAFPRLLRTCVSKRSLAEGKLIHAHIIKSGIQHDIYLGNNLVHMYVRCTSIVDARQVFDKMPERNTISWTAMIAGYAQNNYGEEALKLYCEMHRIDMQANQFTFASVLRACARLAALDQGRQIHAHIIGTEFESNVFVGSALVDMYAKCRNIDDARNMFEKMSERDAVSWNAMIAGYALNGHGEEALNHFNHMQNAGIKPYQATFSSVLMACATLIFLEPGKQVHGHTIKTGLESDVFVGSALLDMYAKCGSIQDAQNVFGKITARDAISWNAMIAGYAHHGLGKEVLRVFKQMKREGMKPNSSTFISVLSACSHAGLVEEGHGHFDSMFRDHEVTPKMEHYACMVDLLGRAGCLDEAHDFIRKMPFEPGVVTWRTLLGACRIHGDVVLAEHAAKRIFKLEPQDTPTWVLLSNVYAAACRWDDVSKVRKIMKDRGMIRNEPERS